MRTDAIGGGLTRDRVLPIIAIGAVAGFLAALFGVGGGIVIVPLLISWLAFDPKVATATSLASILFTATAGTIAHGLLDNANVGIALLVGIPAVLGVWLGNSLKRRISARALTLAFAGLLVVVAVLMVAGV